MHIGTQLRAPEGLGSLSKGKIYYLLSSRDDPARVVLVHLWQSVRRMRNGDKRTCQGAELITVPRAVFEDGIDRNQIIACEKQSPVPPWLSEFEGEDLRQILDSHPKDAARVEALEEKIKMAVGSLDKILTSRDPTRELNEIAENCKSNTSRYRLAVCV